MPLVRRLLLALLFVAQVAGAAPVSAEDVPCTKVMSEVNRRVTRRQPVDVSEMAKKMNTKVVWVENCIKSYGRRYRRPGIESDGGRDAVLEGYERGDEEEGDELDDPDEPDRR